MDLENIDSLGGGGYIIDLIVKIMSITIPITYNNAIALYTAVKEGVAIDGIDSADFTDLDTKFILEFFKSDLELLVDFLFLPKLQKAGWNFLFFDCLYENYNEYGDNSDYNNDNEGDNYYVNKNYDRKYGQICSAFVDLIIKKSLQGIHFPGLFPLSEDSFRELFIYFINSKKSRVDSDVYEILLENMPPKSVIHILNEFYNQSRKLLFKNDPDILSMIFHFIGDIYKIDPSVITGTFYNYFHMIRHYSHNKMVGYVIYLRELLPTVLLEKIVSYMFNTSMFSLQERLLIITPINEKRILNEFERDTLLLAKELSHEMIGDKLYRMMGQWTVQNPKYKKIFTDLRFQEHNGLFIMVDCDRNLFATRGECILRSEQVEESFYFFKNTRIAIERDRL